ncbi:hypothetical protein PMAYCL1PPCAC_15548 [Pristionchus mayeri]|uniref:Uncharacterized protein n=1 Tax=Pristionchus mayeri TaxID=1317129 RepID=A0AAN5CJ63_9BILA|nr:hypothetical protein PMAYCL1PPCAC_15548 [Pristionchus mayeri]
MNWVVGATLLAAILALCGAKILERSEENSVELTDHNVKNDHVEFECKTRNYQIYEVRHRVHSCFLPRGAKLVGDCSNRRDDSIKVRISLTTDEVRYFLGKDPLDFVACSSYRVTTVAVDDDYDDESEDDDDEWERLDWRRRELVEKEQGRVNEAGLFNRFRMPLPILHSRINELDQTRSRPLPPDVLILPIDDRVERDFPMARRLRPFDPRDVIIEGGEVPDSVSTLTSLPLLIVSMLAILIL